MKSYVILALVVVTLVAASNLHLNDRYADVLEGRRELTELLLREMYEGYTSRFTVKGEEQFKVFSENIRKMVSHNTKKLSWTQGINDFADLTW